MKRRTALVLLGIVGFGLLGWGRIANWHVINPWYTGADKPIRVAGSGFVWHTDGEYLIAGVVGLFGTLTGRTWRWSNLLTLGAGVAVLLLVGNTLMPVVTTKGYEAIVTGPTIYGPALYLTLLGGLLFIVSGLVGYAPALRSASPPSGSASE